MSLLPTIGAIDQDTGFYNGATSTSMRFRRGVGSNTEINRDPSSAGDRKKHTLSFWVKRCKPSDGSQVILGAFASSYSDFAYFRSDDRFEYSLGNAYQVCTDMKFRDVSAWYHIVAHLDVANSTTTSRLRFWVNGVEQSKTITYGSYPADQDFAFSNTVDQTVGGLTHFSGYELDGYLCDLNFIDGSLVPYTSFGEFKNGIWIPIDIDTSAITYGTNGFRMLFNGTDTDGASTSGTVNANSVGASSVNSNHFHAYSTALANHSALTDSPENNFATYNPLQISNNDANFFLSDGNLALTAANNSGYRNCSATFSPMGFKGYIEFVASALNHKIGIIADTTHPTNQDYASSGPQHVTLEYDGEVKFPNNDTTLRSASDHNLGTLATGDVMGMAFDFTGTNRNVWFHRANTYGTASGGLGNPATGANPIVTATQLNSTRPYRFHFGINNGPVLRINFGQDGAFGGTETAQGNTDANGIGDFYYAPPSGFLALASSNLEEPTISPNSDTQADDHFNTVLFTGGSGDVVVPGVGFKPDWVWMKARSNAQNHSVADSSRGGTKYLGTSLTNDESTINELHFTDDGFTSNTDWHTDGYTYVAWNWKANGGTTTTNDASATSVGTIDSVYQANTTAGFSIVQFEATGSAGTIAHGLSQAPTFMIVKSRDQAGTGWMVYYGDNTDYLLLNSNGATVDGATTWNDTSPTSTVFSVGDNGGDSNNSGGGSMIGYMFHDVEGYSKIGTYNPNNTTDNAFVYTGFKPAMVILKGAELSNQEWCILDNKRPGYNSVYNLNPDSNAAEATSNIVDFVSNGFKIRETGGVGYLTSDYIYIAFAEAPFKYANAG